MLDRTERQRQGIQKWIQSGCRGTLVWPTGCGKTRAALLAIKSYLVNFPKFKVKIIVPTENLRDQWISELIKYNLFDSCVVEIINTAITKKEKVDLLVLDEAHHYVSSQFSKIFMQTNPKHILGLSATFNRLDGKHILLNQFCPVCDTITTLEAIDNNWLSPYREYKVFLDVPDIDLYREYNKTFLDAFAFFDNNFELALGCTTNIHMRNAYAKTVGCTVKEVTAQAFTWMDALKKRKSFIMNHPKKVEVARLILRHRADKKAITFSATIQQAESIGIGYVVHSKKTKKKNRITMEEFKYKDSGVINSATSLDEGADISGLNLAIILCNTSSQRQKTQRVG